MSGPDLVDTGAVTYTPVVCFEFFYISQVMGIPDCLKLLLCGLADVLVPERTLLDVSTHGIKWWEKNIPEHESWGKQIWVKKISGKIHWMLEIETHKEEWKLMKYSHKQTVCINCKIP